MGDFGRYGMVYQWSPTDRGPFVYYAHLSSAVARLPAELNQIGLENRCYFRNKSHIESKMLDRQRRVDKVLAGARA